MDTETLATVAVKKRIAQTKYLSQSILEGDKVVSWDGGIYAFSDEKKTKESLVFEVPVQVKGRKRASIKSDTIKFGMDRADLVNYRNRGGTMLFVVYITPDGKEKIYFSTLTPFSLNALLALSKDDPKPKVTMATLPEGADNLCRIVFTFIKEMKRQKTIRDDHNWTIEEVVKKFGPENIEMKFTLTGPDCDRRDPFSFINSDDFYIYASLKGTDISFAVEHVERIETMVQSVFCVIGSGENAYEEKIEFKKNRDKETVFSIGKGFDFITDQGRSVLKYHPAGSLDEQIHQIRLLLDIVENSRIYVNGKEFLSIKPNAEELMSLKKDEREAQLRWFELIKETLNKLHVTKTFQIEGLSEKDQHNMSILVNAIMFGKTATFKNQAELPTVATIDIGNLKLMLAFRKLENGAYFVEDFFACNIKCTIDREGEIPTSRYCILKKEDYLKCDNIYLQDIIDDFKRYDNQDHKDKMTLCMLEMIKAYDEDNAKTDLLDAALELSNWLKSKEPENLIHKLNCLQCILRTRQLDAEEKLELTNMIMSEETPNEIKAGAYILLGDSSMAKAHIERMSEKEKTEFYSFPIYSILGK